MTHEHWRPRLHMTPPVGWANDPNGLCRFRGTYHVFHQYEPDWPGGQRGWGHFSSQDLVHWEHHGLVIQPDSPEDASGTYSGSAVTLPNAAPDGGDLLRIYYTGNVKEPGEHDYVTSGRQANLICVESADGFALGKKHVLMRNADYPDFCSCHVRDPKVWREDGSWWMLLGARDLDSQGLALVLRSDDGLCWEHAGTVRPDEPLGFMWECPDRIELDGWEYLLACPQGVEGLPWSCGIRDQAGYFPLARGERLHDTPRVRVRDFELWDHGFDFYAPQTLVDGERTILVAWMGLPVSPYEFAPDGLEWAHCLTLPRELRRCEDGRIAQRPVGELERLRQPEVAFGPQGEASLVEPYADLVLRAAPGTGAFGVTLCGALELCLADEVLTLRFLDTEVGAGRTERHCEVGHARDLRVLVDGSAVEVFADDGRAALATRWFPKAGPLEVRLHGKLAETHLYPLER